jgi:hypothetical protein
MESVAGEHIAIALRLGQESGSVQIDPALMEQAIMNLVMHACSAIAKTAAVSNASSGRARLSVETRRAAPSAHRRHPYVMLELLYPALEPDLDRLFDPAPSGDTGLALPLAHSIVTEHNGFLSARAVTLEAGVAGTCIELLLPVADGVVDAVEPDPSLAPTPALPPSVLLLDPRAAVRAELHNHFEAAGFNLLEAADREEALALGQLHEGPLDLLIADAALADGLAEELVQALAPAHPSLQVLRLVDSPPRSLHEIRRPFTQQALAERVRTVLYEARRRQSTEPPAAPPPAPAEPPAQLVAATAPSL